jgi:hypothetical protein
VSKTIKEWKWLFAREVLRKNTARKGAEEGEEEGGYNKFPLYKSKPKESKNIQRGWV